MSESKDTLNDCPFCGGHNMNIVVVHNDYADDTWKTMYEIVCQGCSVTTSRYDSEAEVIESWNTRAEPARCEISEDKAYGYASRLFKHLAPQCTPLPDTLGVLTQLDNYITGLREPKREIFDLGDAVRAIEPKFAGLGKGLALPMAREVAKACADAWGIKTTLIEG